MFMLKCLVEGKNIPGRRQGTVLCLLFPRKQETQNRPLPTPERHGQNGQKKRARHLMPGCSSLEQRFVLNWARGLATLLEVANSTVNGH